MTSRSSRRRFINRLARLLCAALGVHAWEEGGFWTPQETVTIRVCTCCRIINITRMRNHP